MDVTLFLVYLFLYLFIVYYWMTFFKVLTFGTRWEGVTVAALALYFVAFGYEIFYSSFILDGYYELNNSDELGTQLSRVWIATLSIEAIRLVAFTFYRVMNLPEVIDMLLRIVLAVHALAVGFLPIASIVYLIESIELVDEEDKMMALVAAYVIAIVGVVGSLPWSYLIVSNGKN